ncbi:PIG-X [Kalaharituber pfeilii]|nr:PIG-X [Kalaharituber pfeilii]
MKQRVTFLVKPNSPPTDPDQFSLSESRGSKLKVRSLHAARQEKWTILPHEIPLQIQDALKPLSELYIRWSTTAAYDSFNPFSSRAPAGLHIITTPVEALAQDTDHFCSLLRLIFGNGASCSTILDAFVEIPGGKQQFHAAVPDLSAFVEFFQRNVCRKDKICLDETSLLRSADYLDIDYHEKSAVPQGFTISAYWSSSPDGPWDTTVQKLAQDHRVEVGIFDQRPSISEEKLSFGGILTVLGESEELKPTLFSFQTRHFRSAGVFSGSFKEPTGLHPKFLLRVAAGKAPSEECALHAYFTLPKTFFVDKYQLSDPQLLKSLGLHRLKGLYGEADLEAPAWTQSRWGSSVLLEIEDPAETGLTDVELPLHLRYLEPISGSEYIKQDMPWPVVFWACSSHAWEKFHISPFDRIHLGYEHMFENDTAYYHLSPKLPEGGSTYSSLQVPVMNLDYAVSIKFGTAVVVGIGFLYITLKVIMASLKKKKITKVE